MTEELKQDLLARWKALFGRMPLLAEAAGRGLRTLYATGDRFGLKAYTPGTFPAGGRTSKDPIPGCDNWVYRLNAAGRPVHMAMHHSFNQIDWQGMYTYSHAEAEHTEFCMTTQIPSEYQRLALSDGQPASFQRLRVQSRGDIPVLRGMSPGLQADRILSDPYLHEIEIEIVRVAGRQDSVRVGLERIPGEPAAIVDARVFLFCRWQTPADCQEP